MMSFDKVFIGLKLSYYSDMVKALVMAIIYDF